jgi:hypothetical protein
VFFADSFAISAPIVLTHVCAFRAFVTDLTRSRREPSSLLLLLSLQRSSGWLCRENTTHLAL